jgi:hypothetical protein
MGEWRYSFILNLSTRWRWVVSFTPRPHYLRGRSAQLGWTGSRAGLVYVQKRTISLPCRELNPSPPARSPSLYRLCCKDYSFSFTSKSWIWYYRRVLKRLNCQIINSTHLSCCYIRILYWTMFMFWDMLNIHHVSETESVSIIRRGRFYSVGSVRKSYSRSRD